MAQTESMSVVTLGLLLYSTMHLLTFDLTKDTSGRGGVSVFGADNAQALDGNFVKNFYHVYICVCMYSNSRNYSSAVQNPCRPHPGLCVRPRFYSIVPVYVSARYMFQSPNYNHRLQMVEHSF